MGRYYPMDSDNSAVHIARKEQTMSNDLIRRSDAIKALCDITNNSDMQEDWHRGISVSISALYRVPSADRPQGKWKAKSFHECFCDNCGFSFDVMKCEFLENMKFCPNCGVPKGADDE